MFNEAESETTSGTGVDTSRTESLLMESSVLKVFETSAEVFVQSHG